jgi:hypothetical protein
VVALLELEKDGAYLSADVLLDSQQDYGVDLIGPMRQDKSWQAREENAFDLAQFAIDWEKETVTCPNGQTVPMVPGKDAQFPASACDGCPVRAQCTKARLGQGRSLTIREDEQFQQKLRAKIKTKRGRASLRKRTAVEHAIAHHVAHRGRQARYKGLRKNQFDGRRHAAVSNLLRLMELAPEVGELVERRELDMGHARALLGLENRRKQVELALLVVKKGLSVRETEALVRRLSQPPGKGATSGEPGAGAKGRDPNVERLEHELMEKLGAQVHIQHTAKGAGKLVVAYNNLDELDGILAHIQ